MKKTTVLFLILSSIIFAQGKVYIVMGSDTGIWNGLDTKKYHHTYGLELYTDPDMNAYKVMDPAFRAPMKDSYGTPLKMTWWMMSGNTFRHSVNTNIPYPNSMTFYLMKEYHGENMAINGDELSLHYHTFYWSDYDGDGVYWYNQALTFEESKEDFEFTLAQNLLDENVFPVSFRSGWHAMDNDWQHYLEDILPFSMHNDYPAVHTDTLEPLDNLYDWSLAPGEWEPYHPDSENYQVPGNLNGYNLRSEYMAHVNTTKLNDIFQKAASGKDQMACIWAHLPEADFLYNIQRVDSLLQLVSANYPGVKFQYCTGIEAMQEWLNSGDNNPPEITITPYQTGEGLIFEINSDELLFQYQPFVAVKDIYERYTRLQCRRTGLKRWNTIIPVDPARVAKLGIAATDTSGNLTTKFINYLPDEKFYDNNFAGYDELTGVWSSTPDAAWKDDARIVQVQPGDSAICCYTFEIDASELYSIFVQVPEVENPAGNILFNVKQSGEVVFSNLIDSPLNPKTWISIGNVNLDAGSAYSLEIIVKNNGSETKQFVADVIKISALVRDKELFSNKEFVDLELVQVEKTRDFSITIGNKGYENVTLNSIAFSNGVVSTATNFPKVIEPNSENDLNFSFYSTQLGAVDDTIIIYSDDFIHPVYKIPVSALVEPPFIVIDNEDAGYSETGSWSTSVTQAYGISSRYTYINQNIGISASFNAIAETAGEYDIFMIVPKTVNSANHALYKLYKNNQEVKSTYRDQNLESDSWVYLFSQEFGTGDQITLKVIDDGTSSTGPVLRADAAKFALKNWTTGLGDKVTYDYSLDQNYPNPFNPVTNISFEIKEPGFVNIAVFDILGRKVNDLVNEKKDAGKYNIFFNASGFSSGVYIYRIQSGSFIESKKMVILK